MNYNLGKNWCLLREKKKKEKQQEMGDPSTADISHLPVQAADLLESALWRLLHYFNLLLP